MAKKINRLDTSGGFVFSTNENFEFDNESCQEETLPLDKQKLEAHLEKKNRNGKIATIIKGFQGTEDDLKTLGKLLKTKCGVGGSVKDNEIIIQGDFREKIIQLLQNEGYRIKRVGS